jgi:gluconokinase
MSHSFPRSPYDTVKGLAYFARMLDKIRLHAAGKLEPVYQKHLGIDFDGRCLTFLGVKYEPLRELVLAGGKSDEQILEWCYQNGRRPTDDEVEIWSDFMRKRGWRDAASDRIAFRLKEGGLESKDEQAVTMFDFIDLDEGRTPPDFTAWQPPRIKS